MEIPQIIAFQTVCLRHQKVFVEICQQNGIINGAAMELIRRRFVDEARRKYPDIYVRSRRGECPGCIFASYGPESWDWVLAAVRALCHHEPLPPAVYRPWWRGPKRRPYFCR